MSLILLQETTGAGTPPATEGGGLGTIVLVAILLAILAIVLAAIYVGVRSPAAGAAPRSWLEYGNFFIVAIGIGAVLVAFLVAMSFATDLDLFNDTTELLAVLTALFGVIGTLVGTFFGVKAGSDAAEGAQKLATSAMATDTTPPAILSVNPPAGAVGILAATPVTASFSKDMNPATITTNTFRLAERDTETPAPAGVATYDPPTKRATLTPGAALAPGTAYRVTITTDVRDLADNALPAVYTWDFTVAE